MSEDIDFNSHNCYFEFETEKIDSRCGVGVIRCSGVFPMYVYVWYPAQDGQEYFCDEYVKLQVNACPICGMMTSSGSIKYLGHCEKPNDASYVSTDFLPDTK